MDQQERKIIEDMFGKLQQAEAQGGARDPQAEQLIRSLAARQPAAPYYMLQAILVQEHALMAANSRIEQLETELSQRPATGGGGGFLSGLFGSGRPAVPPPQPMQTPWNQPGRPMPVQQGPWGGGYGQPQGGGFLAGAMQTALGVAGGVLIGSAIADMLGGGEAQAAEPDSAADSGEADAGGFDGGDGGDA